MDVAIIRARVAVAAATVGLIVSGGRAIVASLSALSLCVFNAELGVGIVVLAVFSHARIFLSCPIDAILDQMQYF
jgi:hypothetical protein